MEERQVTDVMVGEGYDIDYQGWAPCVHNKEQEVEFIRWVVKNLPPEVRTKKVDQWHGGLIENLLWRINDLGGSCSLCCDQWTICIAEGKIGDRVVRTQIQGDTFLLSIAETYRWWKEKYGEITGMNGDE